LAVLVRHWGVRRWRVDRLKFVLTFVYAASNIQNASQQFVWWVQICFVNCAVHPTAQTEIEINEEINEVKGKVKVTL